MVRYSTQKVKKCIGLECSRNSRTRFGLCRLCFKKNADRGNLPGFTKI
ncbi:MAG: hypothetical protein MRERC_1c124 [Mycoplasmataceae bacterium RC_NB112A]|nr:MAG: hypothetical protein MRERC_1c124 [Mycoplasmataceae bacterium RC_NB112A]